MNLKNNLFLLLIKTSNAFRFNFNLKRHNSTAPMIISPLEELLQKKTVNEIRIHTIYEFAENDISPAERLLDDIIDLNELAQMNGSELTSILFYLAILFNKNNSNMQKNRRRRARIHSKKTKNISWTLFFLSVLFHFTRNVKPVL
jgi:hypothetical protein